MQFKKINFIINPASGKEEPILSYLHKVMSSTEIDWGVTVTRTEHDIYQTAKKLVGQTDLVVVYGGDGSITKAAAALVHSQTPLAIIPGGTANIVSKELGIPQDSREALELLTTGQTKILAMDTGEANGTPFLLRVNLGIMADMIIDADSALKDKLGQLAYGITALQTTIAANPVNYTMRIDGEEFTEQGVSLTVTNAGHIGIGDMALLPGISVEDGLLDVILMHNADPLSVLQAAGSALFNTKSDVLRHWRCKEIVIKTEKKMKYICDDCEEEADEISIKIHPAALLMLVPLNKD